MRRRSANAACGDAPPSNKHLEWTGRRQVGFDGDSFLPATQGQRWANLKIHATPELHCIAIHMQLGTVAQSALAIGLAV